MTQEQLQELEVVIRDMTKKAGPNILDWVIDFVISVLRKIGLGEEEQKGQKQKELGYFVASNYTSISYYGTYKEQFNYLLLEAQKEIAEEKQS